jgi:hypothetical protein
VLLPSDRHRKPITSITAMLLPFVTYLLTLPPTSVFLLFFIVLLVQRLSKSIFNTQVESKYGLSPDLHFELRSLPSRCAFHRRMNQTVSVQCLGSSTHVGAMYYVVSASQYTKRSCAMLLIREVLGLIPPEANDPTERVHVAVML